MQTKAIAAARSAGLLGFSALLVLLTACGGNQAGTGNPNDESDGRQPTSPPAAGSPQPVELVLYGTGINVDAYMKDFGEPIMKKFPYITAKVVRSDQPQLEAMIAAGDQMDIMMTRDFQMPLSLLKYGLGEDLADLIAKNKYDLAPLDPQAVDYVRKMGSGKLLGLPVMLYNPTLIYNVELFDKFGVSYPKDGMTWDEAYELARKLTRQEGGVNYRGMLVAFSALSWQNQIAAGFVDPKTFQPLFATDNKWQKHVDVLTRFFKIPGNEVDAKSVAGGAMNTAFYTDQTAAMFATVTTTAVLASYPRLNWNLASVPTFGDIAQKGSQPSSTVFSVSSGSKHKEEAFRVLAYLTSKQFQLSLSQNGNISVLSRDPDVRAAFGKGVAGLQGKNVQAFLTPYAPAMTPTPYDTIAQAQIFDKMNRVATGEFDVNTALRMAAEETGKLIAAEKAK